MSNNLDHSNRPVRQPLGTNRVNHTRLAVAVALFGLLFSLYLLTYSSVFNSDDERYIFDTTESIVKRGNLLLNQTTYIRRFRTSGVEPAQPVLAVPLYLLANQIPFVGNVQTTFLFNPLITALTAVLLFYFALDLGYRKREALLGGLIFGIGTIAWPYTRTFFREPLAGLTLFATFFFLHRWRKSLDDAEEGQKLGWLVLGVGTFVISAFTKEAALIAAPVVIAYAVPGNDTLRLNRRSLFLLAGSVLAAAALLSIIILTLQSEAILAITGRYAFSNVARDLLAEGLPYLGEGTLGFLASPGKSVFIFSPLALLAVAGLFTRDNNRRESWLAIGLLLIFALGYAAIQAELWHGGSGWGPRYLVPVTPVLILGGLSALRWILASTSIWPRLGLGILAALSVFVQVPGLLINIHDYYAALSPLGSGAPWTLAIWGFRYSQIFGHLRMIQRIPLDLAWVRPSTDWLTIGLLVGGIVVLGAVLFWLATRVISRQTAVVSMGSILVFVASLSVTTLRRTYDDPYFNGDDPALFEMIDYLSESLTPGDVIVLSNPRYVNFFANYYKGDNEWFSMPRSPGERHSEDEVAQVVSDNPEDLISPASADLMGYLTEFYPNQSVWMVVDGGPFTPWYPRPPEWWAAERYYPVHTEEFSSTARLVQYLSVRAPELETPPAHTLSDRLGESIILDGYDLDGLVRPDVTTFHPGDELGLSLVWSADSTPAEDYVSAVFIIGPDGELHLQQDRVPVASFRPTSSWASGETLRDNYGFVLHPELPLGRYQIWVAMYSWPSQERLPAFSAAGDVLGDHLAVAEFELLSETEALD